VKFKITPTLSFLFERDEFYINYNKPITNYPTWLKIQIRYYFIHGKDNMGIVWTLSWLRQCLSRAQQVVPLCKCQNKVSHSYEQLRVILKKGC